FADGYKKEIALANASISDSGVEFIEIDLDQTKLKKSNQKFKEEVLREIPKEVAIRRRMERVASADPTALAITREGMDRVIRENNMTNNLEIEIKKRKKEDEGFIFTSEDNDRKRTYLIYSRELKRRLREIAFPFGVISDKCKAEYGVENKKTGDKIVYQTGNEENPDKLVLISGKYTKAITDGNEELLKQQELEKQKKEEAEQKRIDGL
ncbi:1141_t:CDS:2, partial [Funneliformis geosporum]